MNKKMILIFLVLLTQSLLAYVPEVRVSKRPVKRPENLQTTSEVEDGQFNENGKMRLSIKLYDDGVFYQRDGNEYLIPLNYYLKNEYPEVDFSELTMTDITVHTRTLGDYAYTRFYDSNSMMLKEVYIPKVQYPGEAFGEYTNAKLNQDELNDLLYVGISGVQNINNITAHFTKGSPNFSMDLSKMPNKGNYVGEIEGFEQQGFNEFAFNTVMTEVRKMSLEDPGYNNWNNRRDNNWNNRGDDNWGDWSNGSNRYDNPSPSVVPYRGNERSQLFQSKQITAYIGDVSLLGKRIKLVMTQGSGQLTGYRILKANGKTKYRDLETFVDVYKPAETTVSVFDSEGQITFIFSEVSQNAQAMIITE